MNVSGLRGMSASFAVYIGSGRPESLRSPKRTSGISESSLMIDER